MKKQTSIRMSTATREKLDELRERHGTATEVIAVAIDRLHREEVIQVEDTGNTVKMTADNKVRCGNCGHKVKAEYKAQDPAPCGCAWVWENGRLIAVSHR